MFLISAPNYEKLFMCIHMIVLFVFYMLITAFFLW